jgi:hypothetical protein
MNRRKPRRGLAVLFAAAMGILMIALPSSAAARDRNHDKIPDRWEKRHSLSLKVKQTKRDQDSDALNNRREFVAGDDPHDADSDNDGVEDGDEGAGTVDSFDGTTLTIALFGGGSVTGEVTDATEISCDNGDDHGDEDNDGEGGHSGPGDGEDDHSGPGDGDEDHSGPGDGDDEEVGDDDEADDDDEAGDDDAAVLSPSDEADDDEADEDEGDDDQGEDDDEQACSVDNLTPGAVVQEAELELEHGQAIFEEIELAA